MRGRLGADRRCYARTDLKGGFTIAAYGGNPVETAATRVRGFSVRRQVSQGLPGIYTSACLPEGKERRKDFRKEEGLDLWIRPLSKLELMAHRPITPRPRTGCSTIPRSSRPLRMVPPEPRRLKDLV